jgi:hypothetical protein
VVGRRESLEMAVRGIERVKIAGYWPDRKDLRAGN